MLSLKNLSESFETAQQYHSFDPLEHALSFHSHRPPCDNLLSFSLLQHDLLKSIQSLSHLKLLEFVNWSRFLCILYSYQINSIFEPFEKFRQLYLITLNFNNFFDVIEALVLVRLKFESKEDPLHFHFVVPAFYCFILVTFLFRV